MAEGSDENVPPGGARQSAAYPHYTAPISTPPTTTGETIRVTVVDFDMSFFHLVGFLVKAAIAAIPAALILVVIGMLVFAFFGALGTFVGR